MEKITIGPYNLKYNIVHSRRRTVKIRVTAADCLEVTAPLRFPHAEIARLLITKETWITAHLAKQAELAASPVNAGVEPGAELLYLGGTKRLTVLTGRAARPSVSLDGDRLFAHLPALLPPDDRAAALAAAVRRWYVEAARTVLAEKTALWAERLGVRPSRIFIREQKSRWGSCSSRGNINYNWRIIMAPPAIIDYLVIHELTHMKVPNHSAAFWQLVGEASPAYKEHRKWLRRNGALLGRLFATG